MELNLEFLAVGLLILLIIAVAEEIGFRKRQRQRRQITETAMEDPEGPSPPALEI